MYLGFADNRLITAARFLTPPLLVMAVALLAGCTSTGRADNPPFGGIPNPASQQVKVTPNTLSFTALGIAAAQDVTVFQSTLDRSYAESDNCSGVATIARTKFSRGTATYAVTPSGAGGCVATFSGIGASKGTLSISSTPYGSVSPNPTSLTFLATGASYAQTLSVSQVNYAGAYGESDTCSGIVAVAQTSNGGGTASYAVTPVSAGSCQITLTGGNNLHAIVGVSVTTTGITGQ